MEGGQGYVTCAEHRYVPLYILILKELGRDYVRRFVILANNFSQQFPRFSCPSFPHFSFAVSLISLKVVCMYVSYLPTKFGDLLSSPS